MREVSVSQALKQPEALIISESPLRDSPRATRRKSPRGKSPDSQQQQRPRAVHASNAKSPSHEHTTDVPARAPSIKHLLMVRTIEPRAVSGNTFSCALPRALAAYESADAMRTEAAYMGQSTAPAAGPMALSLASTPTVADGAGSWT